MKRRNVLILLAGVLSACTPLPEFNAVSQTVGQSTERVNAYLGDVTVVIAPVDELQGYMAPSAGTVTSAWRVGVMDALNRSGIFRPGATRKVNLEAKIIKLDAFQNNDLSMTATAVALYRIVDADTNEVLWVRGITGSGTVSYQGEVTMVNRERISLNMAIQDNIAQFVALYGK